MNAKDFFNSSVFDFFEKMYFELCFMKKDEIYNDTFNSFYCTLKNELENNLIYLQTVLNVFAKDVNRKLIADNYFKFSYCNNY